MKSRRLRVGWQSSLTRFRDALYTGYTQRMEGLLASRLFRQAVVSLIAVALVLGLQVLPLSLANRVESGIRYIMTTEYNFKAAAERIASAGVRRESPGLPVISRLFKKQEEDQAGVLPTMVLPAAGEVTSGFGWRSHPVTGADEFHQGVDIGVPRGGEVVAALDGVVAQVGESKDYGKLLEIDHGSGLTTLYGHLSEVLVRVGDRVEKGTPIARAGQTGNATSSHLHFEVRVNGKQVDPKPWLGLDR